MHKIDLTHAVVVVYAGWYLGVRTVQLVECTPQSSVYSSSSMCKVSFAVDAAYLLASTIQSSKKLGAAARADVIGA